MECVALFTFFLLMWYQVEEKIQSGCKSMCMNSEKRTYVSTYTYSSLYFWRKAGCCRKCPNMWIHSVIPHHHSWSMTSNELSNSGTWFCGTPGPLVFLPCYSWWERVTTGLLNGHDRNWAGPVLLISPWDIEFRVGKAGNLGTTL